MIQLEIIHLRSSGESAESLGNRIRESIGERGENPIVVLYGRHGLETDLAVHIRSGANDKGGPSQLALQLASELRAYGLVELTLWEEIG